MSPLPSDDRRTLLELARRAIVEAVCHERLLEPPSCSGLLAAPSGAFVSLHHRGRLCGCMGQAEPSESLVETVIRSATLAALRDPRFRPVRQEEIPELEIEVSVLSVLASGRADEIDVGRHGVVVVRENRRALLLPQIATERHWSREQLLEQTCLKAGLAANAWMDPGTSLFTFTAEVFSDADVWKPTPQ